MVEAIKIMLERIGCNITVVNPLHQLDPKSINSRVMWVQTRPDQFEVTRKLADVDKGKIENETYMVQAEA